MELRYEWMTVKTRSHKPKKKRRLWLKITLAVVLVLFIGTGTYVYTIYHNAKKTVNDKMHQTVSTIDNDTAKEKVNNLNAINILLLGVDQRPGDQGRSDALIVLSLDPQKEKMNLVSIPRDTRAEIVGKGREDKINHAFAYGGADMSIATVENLLDIDLDYYVKVNMEGLTDLVDTLGGITVDNQIDWYDEGFYKKGYHFQKGLLTLDGDQTLGYVRMRHKDPEGDFGRTKRQRQVIEAVIDRGASFASINKINDMIDVLGNNMATNMDFDDMKNLLLHYKNTRKNTESYMLEGEGTKIDGIYYLVVPDEEIQKVHGMIASY